MEFNQQRITTMTFEKTYAFKPVTGKEGVYWGANADIEDDEIILRIEDGQLTKARWVTEGTASDLRVEACPTVDGRSKARVHAQHHVATILWKQATRKDGTTFLAVWGQAGQRISSAAMAALKDF
jgi:hypothetical protein